jgi:hypothetical protein
MNNYKAAAEKTDEAERLLTPAMPRKGAVGPDLCIAVYDVKGNKGTIVCHQMKCEFPSGDLRKDVGKLAQEWLDLREAYL